MAETPNVTTTVENLKLNTNIVNLDGHKVTGAGDDLERLKLTLPPRYIKRTGADGHVQYDGTGDLGGEAIVILKFGAPSLLTMQDWLLEGVSGDYRQFNGTVICSDGRRILLRNGLLTGHAPGWIMAGYQAYRFFFEVIHIQ